MKPSFGTNLELGFPLGVKYYEHWDGSLISWGYQNPVLGYRTFKNLNLHVQALCKEQFPNTLKTFEFGSKRKIA